VPALSTPDVDFPPPLSHLVRYESVALLLDRARGVRPDFALTEDNRVAITRMCAALDGMPLAIELAATRLRSLTAQEILARLDDRFRLLTGGGRDVLPRQQTLRALMDWSYDLCTEPQRRLWANLSVFPGGFDVRAAEAICADRDLDVGDVFDVLDQLVAKSVVLSERVRGETRYRALATVREYGAERLEDPARVRRRHRDHYLARAREMSSSWCGPGQAEALERMQADHANLVAALEWSLVQPGEEETAASMAAALRFHWIVGNHMGEGRQLLERALAIATEPTPERGEALWVTAWVALVQGDHAAGRSLLDDCAAIAELLADASLAAHVDHWSALAMLFAGELEAAIELFDRAIAGHTAAGDTNARLVACFQLVITLVYAGHLQRARATCTWGMRLCDRHGERWNHAYLLGPAPWWTCAPATSTELSGSAARRSRISEASTTASTSGSPWSCSRGWRWRAAMRTPPPRACGRQGPCGRSSARIRGPSGRISRGIRRPLHGSSISGRSRRVSVRTGGPRRSSMPSTWCSVGRNPPAVASRTVR
jgi:hypothetical protein